MIPADKIADVRSRCDIVKVVSRHVELKRRGQNYFGLCPFHSEKTSSFSVHPGKQIFHCFGCGQTGDVFNFLMQTEGRSFYESLRSLADEAGVELPEPNRSPEAIRRERDRRTERQRALEINDKVATFYQERLAADVGLQARRYLEQRGISLEIAERFRLGWAPEGWDSLCKHLADQKTPFPLAERLSLILARSGGRGHYDFFRGRIMFPVMGAGGEVLGFGGRLIKDLEGVGKYINTSETPAYRKDQAVYGLHAARRAMSAAGQAIVVEGNFDVIALHQAGFDNTVAPMGTAFTEKQALLLRRFARTAVAIFDGDAAGRAAAGKSAGTFLDADIDAKIAILPEKEDPDSLVRSGGPAALERFVKAALPAVDYVMSEVLSGAEHTIPGRVRSLETLAPLLARVTNSTVRDLYAGKVATALEIEVSRVRAAIRAAQAGVTPRTQADGVRGVSPGRQQQLPPDELKILGLVADQPLLLSTVVEEGVLGLLSHEGIREVLARLVEMQKSGEVDWAELVKSAPEAIAREVEAQLFGGSFEECEDPDRAWSEAVSGLRAKQLTREARDLRNRARRAHERGDEGQERELTMRALDLDRERRTLSLT